MRKGAKYRQGLRFRGLVWDCVDDKQYEDYEANWKVDVEAPLTAELSERMNRIPQTIFTYSPRREFGQDATDQWSSDQTELRDCNNEHF